MSAVPAFGLVDPVHDAQETFRVALDAMARPGRIAALGPALPGVALGGAMARLLLTLTDEETPVWWQEAGRDLPRWLRFHVGARSVADAGGAAFAAITRAADIPELRLFPAGSAEQPEQSCTLLLEVPSLRSGPVMHAHGPGIRGTASLCIAGLPEGFWAEWQASHAEFPRGVDIFFTCGDELLALPRSTRIGRLQEA